MGVGGMENQIDRILEFVTQADDIALNELLNAISKRYCRLHPDWEVVFLSFCKGDRAKRDQQIRDAFHTNS